MVKFSSRIDFRIWKPILASCVLVLLALATLNVSVRRTVYASPLTSTATTSSGKSWYNFYWDDPLQNAIIKVENITDRTPYGVPRINPVTKSWFAIQDRGIWKSTDQGKTWHNVNPGLRGIRTLFFTPNGTALLGTRSELYRSTDDGNTWSKVLTFSSGHYAVGWSFDYYNNTVLFLGEYGKQESYPVYIWKSTDNGKTWQVGLNVTKFFEKYYSERGVSYFPRYNHTHVHRVLVDKRTGYVFAGIGDAPYTSFTIFSPNLGNDWYVMVGAPNQPVFGEAMDDRVVMGGDWGSELAQVYLYSKIEYYPAYHSAVTTWYKASHKSWIEANMTMFGDHSFWSTAYIDGVMYGALQYHRGGWAGIWVTIDGFNWYFAYKCVNASTHADIPMNSATDGKYLYFSDASGGVFRMLLLTKDEVAYLTRGNESSGILLDSSQVAGGDENYLDFTTPIRNWTITFEGISRINYIRNSGFETSTNPTALPDGYSLVGNALTLGSVKWAWGSDDPWEGRHYLLINHFGPGSVYLNFPPLENGVEGGQEYVLIARYKTNTSSPYACTFVVSWLSAAGSLVRTDSVNLLGGVYPEKYWKIWYVKLTAPVGAVNAKLLIENINNALWLDGLFFGKASDEDPFYPYVNGIQNTSNAIVTIESNGLRQTFNAGNLTEGRTITFKGSIPLVGLVRLNATIEGSYIVHYEITYVQKISSNSTTSSLVNYTTSTYTHWYQMPELDYLFVAIFVLAVLFVIALVVRRKK